MTPVKRIEKDFLLKTLYDEQIPVMYLCDRTEYILRMEKPAKSELVFKSDRPIAGLRPRKKLDLMFDYKNQVVFFPLEVSAVKDNEITGLAPDCLYKNPDRSYSRVHKPRELRIQLTFQGDRYSLHYPRVQKYESGDIDEWMDSVDTKDLQGLIDQMASWIRGFASGYRMVVFKEVKPTTTEERIVSETGKSLFLPSTLGRFPQADPYPKKRLIIEETFRRYLESTGVDPEHMDSSVTRFIRQKHDAGILSDLWAPILFQEYVIGYIRVWINQQGKRAFDYTVVETLYQFATVVAHSLEINGYFNSGRIRNEPFEGKLVDISASGMLFSYPSSGLSAALLPDTELVVNLSAAKRTVRTTAKIVRRYKDKTTGYFGCRFLDMAPEDMRFLFEYLYGKPFTDSDASLTEGSV